MTARILPPKTTGATAPGIAHDHVADLVAAHVVEDRLVVGRVRAVDRHDADRRHGRRVERQHDRRQRAGRQVGNHAERQRVDLRQGPVGIDVALEVVADDAGADDRPRLLPQTCRWPGRSSAPSGW